jgi:hypothetical protein
MLPATYRAQIPILVRQFSLLPRAFTIGSKPASTSVIAREWRKPQTGFEIP